MARYPVLVDIAWHIIEKMVIDWQKDPFLFYYESDIQAELYSRLTAVYRYLGVETMAVNRPWYSYLEIEPQNWNRVCCEPIIYYDYEGKRDAECKPDIVIWKDINNIDLEVDKDENVNYPMLFATEIKYGMRKGNLRTKELLEIVKEKIDWDLEKLETLVQSGDLDFACALYLSWSRSSIEEKAFLWHEHKEGVDILVGQLPYKNNQS